MRAITIVPDQAAKILSGQKNCENRMFFAKIGDILICSGKGRSCDSDIPGGVALCVVSIIGYVYTTQDGETYFEIDGPGDEGVEIDLDIRGYIPGSIGWILDNVRPVAQIPIRGMPGIFNVPDDLIIYTSPTIPHHASNTFPAIVNFISIL